MEVRHNTKLLEQAVELVVQRAGISARSAEALAAEQLSRASARRWLSVGAAIAIAALGIGLGVWFARDGGIHSDDRVVRKTAPSVPFPEITPTAEQRPAAPVSPPTVATSTPVATAQPNGGSSTVPSPTPSEIHKPVVNYTKFASLTKFLNGRQWDLQAGHQFASDTARDWSPSWCYTNVITDGVSVHVELATRTDPSANPIGPISNAQTLQQVGLTDSSAIDLATNCPWLDDRRFVASDFASAPNRVPATAAPVSTYSPSTPTPLITPTSSSQSPIDVSINQYLGYDLVGHDEGPFISNIDAISCRQRCESDFHCDGFVHNAVSNGACFLKSFQGTGILKAKVESNSVVTSGVKGYAEASVYLADFNIKHNRGIEGNSYLNITSSLEECERSCVQATGCKAFVYKSASQNCSLLSDAQSWLLSNSGTISGLKN